MQRSRSRSRSRHRHHETRAEDTPKSVKQIIFESRLNPLNQRALSRQYFEILRSRRSLPVFESLDIFEEAYKKNPVIIVEGETGSGKTTQIPQALLLHLLKSNLGHVPHIACTQPRRVAAISVAKRVAEEMDVTCGEEVGYSVRFEEKTSSKTMLKYVTDGMLLREAITDPLLRKYDVVILDEVHERTLSTDVILGMVKEIFHYRSDLKLVVMSATMDAASFQHYFNNAPLFKVPGCLFPVEIFYTAEPEQDYLQAAIRTVIQIHLYEGPGDVLLFLTGEQEIMDACNKLLRAMTTFPSDKRNLIVVPLFSSLPPAQQQAAFEPTPHSSRKVVISTNIAETSVTINGIVYVVDTGFCKQKVFDPRTRIESLLVTPISQAAAKQRAGRAGRTQPGKCFRLYTEQSYLTQLPVSFPPCQCSLLTLL